MNWQEFNPQNPINPQDSIGDYHNQLLDYFITNIDKISIGSPLKTIPDTLNLIIPKAFELYSQTPDQANLDNAYSVAAVSIIKSKDCFNNFFKFDNAFNEEFRKMISEINQIVTTLTTYNLISILNLLKTKDTDIANSNLTTELKDFAFQYNSIARYSSTYWVIELNNTQFRWFKDSDLIESAKNDDPPKWVYADIKTAFGSALFGGFACLPCVLAGSAGASALQAYIDYNNEKGNQ